MKAFLKLIGSTATLLFVTLTAVAHHTSSIYDHGRSVTLHGTVTKFAWTNPHVHVEIAMTNDAGESVSWVIEGLAPAAMTRVGWSRQTLVPAEQVIITGHPARNPGSRMILGGSVVKGDGTRLIIPSLREGSSPPVDLPTPIAADSLSGIWVTRWNPEIASKFLQAKTPLMLTDKGVAAMRNYDTSMDPGSNCIPEPIPYVMIFPAGKRLEIGEELTTIRDEIGTERSVYMNVDSHDGASFEIHGHSIGWWEGDVLVVDTTHFIDHRRGLALWGLASGSEKHLVERFELNSDRTVINYTFVLEDPEYLAEPITETLALVHRPDISFVNEPCDFESAHRYLDG